MWTIGRYWATKTRPDPRIHDQDRNGWSTISPSSCTRISHPVDSITPRRWRRVSTGGGHAARCPEWMRASSKDIGAIWNHKRGNAATIAECCDWNVDCSLGLLSEEVDADSWSRINEENAQIYKLYSSVCLCGHLLSNSKKFSLAIIPTSLLHALVCLLPVFLSCLPLVSPDSFLCLLSVQVSNTSSEQWPIVFYWAALVSLPLPFLLPSIYLPLSFFSTSHSFPFHCHPTSGRTGDWNGKKKEATKKEDEWRMHGFVWNSEGKREKRNRPISKRIQKMERNMKQWEMKNSSLAVGEWRTGHRVKAGTRRRKDALVKNGCSELRP